MKEHGDKSGRLEAWGDDVALMGPDAPKNDGSIKHMIEYLLTVYERFGNTTITANLQWGAAALWKRDEAQKRVAELEAELAEEREECEDARKLLETYEEKLRETARSSTPTNDMQLWQGPWNDGPAPYYKIPCADYHRLQQKLKDEAQLRESWQQQASIWQQRSTPSAIERKLDKPALVGNTRFGVGIKWETVIERAQREHVYQVTPEKEAARMERVRTFVDGIKDGPHREESVVSQVGVCPRCGVNRFEAPCPNGYMAATMGQCPMSGRADDTAKP